MRLTDEEVKKIELAFTLAGEAKAKVNTYLKGSHGKEKERWHETHRSLVDIMILLGELT